MGLMPMGLAKGKCIAKQVGRELALELVSRLVRHCIRQPIEIAVECSAELHGSSILSQVRGVCALLSSTKVQLNQTMPCGAERHKMNECQ